MNSCIYNGIIKHQRFTPIKHSLNYNTFSLFVDLDEIESLTKNISIFSLNKFNIFSFYNVDHGARDGSLLKDWVLKNIKKFNISNNITKIKLLCYPRIFGYVFNPLSIFYCYDKESLKAILYEVKNTFDEQHTYIFPVNKNSKIISQQCDKKFYVSPFIEMETDYNFRLTEPDDLLRVYIKQTDKNKNKVLIACQTGKKEPMNTKQLAINFLIHPMMTFKIILGIHFEALKLWKKGAIFQKRKVKIKNNITLEK